MKPFTNLAIPLCCSLAFLPSPAWAEILNHREDLGVPAAMEKLVAVWREHDLEPGPRPGRPGSGWGRRWSSTGWSSWGFPRASF